MKGDRVEYSTPTIDDYAWRRFTLTKNYGAITQKQKYAIEVIHYILIENNIPLEFVPPITPNNVDQLLKYVVGEFGFPWPSHSKP